MTVDESSDARPAMPPVVAFGPSPADSRWWALLPSAQILRQDRLTDLLSAVELAMSAAHPGQPFAFCLDPTGQWEPPSQDLPA